MRTILWVAAFALVGVLAVGADEPTFIGAAKCKMCHKVEYTSWEAMSHPKALERLTPEEREDPACLKCHATGGTTELPGVQCEACHGAGSGYKSMKTMKDREASLAAGMVLPDESNCRSCHEGAPHDQPVFDFATAQENGIHEFKAKD